MVRHRPLLLAALAALVALSGCGFLGDQAERVAPGVTADGSVDAASLAAANERTLRSGFTLERTYTQRVPSRDHDLTHETTTRVGPAFERFHLRTRTTGRANGSAVSYVRETWSNGTVVFTRFENETTVRYRRYAAAEFPYGPGNLTERSAVRSLRSGTVTERSDGRYRLQYSFERAGRREATGEGTAVFDAEGAVYNVTASATFHATPGETYVYESVQWRKRGETSVPRPDWFDAAVANTTA